MKILKINKLHTALVGIMMLAILLCCSSQVQAAREQVGVAQLASVFLSADETEVVIDPRYSTLPRVVITATLDSFPEGTEAVIEFYTSFGKISAVETTTNAKVTVVLTPLETTKDQIARVTGKVVVVKNPYTGKIYPELTNSTVQTINVAFLIKEDNRNESDYTYTVTDGKAQVIKYTGAGGVVTIPGTLGGFPVTSIGSGAFYYCKSLTSISIPQGVTSIEGGAFLDCSGLTTINIPQGVTSIGDKAFSMCTNLTSITVANDNLNYKSINGVLFNKTGAVLIACPGGLKSISIPQGVTGIDGGAFYGCTGLISVNIPQGVTSIGYDAFGHCTSLATINIPQGVTSIREGAFENCTGLTTIRFNSATTTISDIEFTIPATSKIIGYDPSTAKTYAAKYNRAFEVIATTTTLQNIFITSPATKLIYTVGEPLDISGLVVSGTYSDYSTKAESITNANITGFNSSAVTTNQVLTITVGAKTTTYKVQIVGPFIPDTTGMTEVKIASSIVGPSKVWTIKLSGIVSETSIKDKIYITNSQGVKQIPICTVTTINGVSQIKVTPANSYTSSDYILWVKDIENGKGTKLKNQVYIKFTVQ